MYATQSQTEPINIMFPQDWDDARIRNIVKRIDAQDKYSLTFSIGKVSEPCVDAEDTRAINALIY